MTVPTTTSIVSYDGTGTVATFAYTWQIFDYTDLTVISWIPATGAITPLVYDTDYTISGLLAPTGGYVTLVAGNLATGTTLFIGNDPEEIQEVLLQQGASFNPADVMNALDKLTREVQAVRRIADNSIQLSEVESGLGYGVTMPTAALRGTGQAIITNGDNGFTLGATTGTAVSSAMQSFVAAISHASARSILGPYGDIVLTTTDRTLLTQQGDVQNVLNYPYLADPTGVTDATSAIQAAVTAAGAKGTTGGGIVFIPTGTYKVTGVITVPAHVSIIGAGALATLINKSGATRTFDVGVSGTNSYGCRISDLRIELSDINDAGIRLIGTVGAVLSNLFIEGPIAASRNNIGVEISGGTVSSYYNKIDTVLCNHMHIGFKLTHATLNSTQHTFINCSSNGDLVAGPDTTSVGLEVENTEGTGTIWLGGYFEHCRYGVRTEVGAATFAVVGLTFEANTTDIYHGSDNVITFTGAMNCLSSKIVIASSYSLPPLQMINCVDSSGLAFVFPSGVVAAPSVGTYGLGTIAYRESPAGSQPIGWVCTVSGSPGTWLPFGTVYYEGSASVTPGAISNGATYTATISVTAALGDYTQGSFSLDLQGCTVSAYISASNTAKVIITNNTGGSVTLGAGTARARTLGH